MIEKREHKIHLTSIVEMFLGYLATYIKEARKLFDEMPHRDTVSYTCVITVYLKNKDLQEAEMVFKAMPHRDIVNESATVDGIKVSCMNDI